MMKKILFGLFVAAFVVFLISPAQASDTVHGAPIVRVHQGASTNWSGYAAETNLVSPQINSVSDVSGQWVVPSVSCSSATTYSSIWVGIDGYSNGTVEQTGTEQDCSGGNPSYYAWYEMYPKFGFKVNVPIHAGDQMSAEVKFIGNGNFTLKIKNLTTNNTFSTNQKSPKAKRQSAEWIVEAPSGSGGVLPLANFGTANLTNSAATINGVTSPISHWPNDAITMVNNANQAKAIPSSLSPDGSSFSVSWQRSN